MQLKLLESRRVLFPLLLIAPFFLWGSSMVAMKGAIPHTTPMFMATLRLLPAGLLVVLAAALMGRSQPKGWAAWLWISLFGLIDGALFQGFLAEGLVRTGAGLGSVMIDSQPLAVAIMAHFLFGEKIGWFGSLGLAFGIVGISLLGLPDEWILSGIQGVLHGDVSLLNWQGNLDSAESWMTHGVTQLFQSGEWLMLMAALSMAVGTVMVRYVCRHADPIAATGWHMVLGGIGLGMISVFNEGQQWQQLTATDWTGLAYASIFGSAIAYGLFFYFASTGNLTSFSALTFLTPVFAILLGNVFLGETLSSLQWFGVGLTLMSIYLINQRDVLIERLKALRSGAIATATGVDKPVESPPST
ncbi:MAG: EamA family transporter [Elainellaceae cyanobacterium]